MHTLHPKPRTVSSVFHRPSMGSASSWYSPLPPSALISCCTMRPSKRAAYDAYRLPSSCDDMVEKGGRWVRQLGLR